MTIDRDLYTKVTGRVPGEAANRMGESMAQAEVEREREVDRAARDLPYSWRACRPRYAWQWVLVGVVGVAGWITAWKAGLFSGWF